MKQNYNNTETRLKKILLSDRMTANESFYIALNKDLTYLLGEYFDIDETSLNVEIENLRDVCYGVNITFNALRLKSIKVAM